MTEYEFLPNTRRSDGDPDHGPERWSDRAQPDRRAGPKPAPAVEELAGTSTFLPGRSETLKLDLEPGKYVIACTVPGHRELGMVGSLAVKSPAPPRARWGNRRIGSCAGCSARLRAHPWTFPSSCFARTTRCCANPNATIPAGAAPTTRRPAGGTPLRAGSARGRHVRRGDGGRSRLMMVHVRRATIGDLKLENTHPFSRGPYTYCHNGTILKAATLVPLADRAPRRRHRLGALLQPPDDRVRARRRDRLASADGRRGVERCRFSALNFLFCDGHGSMPTGSASTGSSGSSEASTSTPTPRPTTTCTWSVRTASTSCWSRARSSTRTQPWTEFGQDELLVCDPADPDHPRVQRLLGDRADEIEFVPLDAGELSGAERGRWAAQRAAAGF